MTTNKRYYIKTGFSLLELLIVIIIVSLLYVLGINTIEKPQNRDKALSPLLLKSIITQSKLFPGEATLLCTNNCQSCYLRQNIKGPFMPYNQRIDLTGIETYSLDNNDNLFLIEYGRFNDEKVCLMLQFYPNGSSTQVILKDKKNVYFLPSFFGKAQKVNSLEEAKALWLDKNQKVSHNGDFY